MITNLFDGIYRSILCLNGELPEAAFFRQKKLPIIAADGAANNLINMGVSPDIIIGDLDSVDHYVRNQHLHLFDPCQNSSDFQKSITYLQKQNLLPAIIVGINGGYLDHILNNINIFMETNSILYAPPLIGAVIKRGQSKLLTLPIDSKISILGIPSACVSSKGLKWELKEYKLAFPGQTSCFNRSITSTVQLEVHEGDILMMVYEQPMC